MAKRKAARSSSRKRSTTRSGRAPAGGRKRSAARKTAGRKTTARKTVATKTNAARRASAATAKRKSAAKGMARAKPAAKKAVARRAAAGRKASPATTGRKPAASSVRRNAKPAAKLARRATPKPETRRRQTPAAPRKAPAALNRNRRTVKDDDGVPTPPSTLDLDRSASAVRTGRRSLRDRFEEHTETSPALTGGDVDADWESAYSVGDEAPGGDNPTPDQDIVDDIGHAIGVEYQDNEELKGDEKIADRDRHRWELDPASAEDYDDHET